MCVWIYKRVSFSYLYNSITNAYIRCSSNTVELLIKLHGDHVTLCLYVQMMHPSLEPLSVRVASL